MKTRAGDEHELFQEECRAQLQRPMENWLRYGFYSGHRPVLDDEPYRSFETMAEYRQWCHDNLPRYLGFRIAGQ